MAESEDEYDFPDDFDGIDFNNIPGLQAPSVTVRAPQVSETPLAVHPNLMPSGVASPATSIGSSGVEEMDASFLAAVDALEARALIGIHQDSGKHGDASTVVSGSPQNVTSPVNRKGKRKADSLEDRDIQVILAGYEIELNCPICCDLLVGAQITNPCGHTCCGECGYRWLARNKHEPTCAVCRSDLAIRNPLLPNFSMDNLVRQHLQALMRSGRPEWQEQGYKTIEWNKRLQSWKEQAATRTRKGDTVRQRRRSSRLSDEDYSYANTWTIDYTTDEDDGTVVARVLRRRAARSRR